MRDEDFCKFGVEFVWYYTKHDIYELCLQGNNGEERLFAKVSHKPDEDTEPVHNWLMVLQHEPQEGVLGHWWPTKERAIEYAEYRAKLEYEPKENKDE